MIEFIDKEFVSLVDRGRTEANDILAYRCQFVNCGFSLTDDESNRSIFRRSRVANSHTCNSFVGPGIIEEVTIENVTSDDTITCYGTLFNHATFLGRIGKLSICTQASPWPLAVPIQQQFDATRTAYYKKIDWAMDISSAHFDELDITGIPAKAIKIDSSRHFILNRSNAANPAWRSRVSSRNDYWLFIIDEFLISSDESTVLVAPKCRSKLKQGRLADGLLELRELGVLM